MIEADKTKLWRAYDEKHTLLGTYIPNCMFEDVLKGKYNVTELRAIFIICRMSFGFRREETNYLGLADFKESTGIATTHLSTAITGLLKRQVIFRESKNGNKYKYAISLLPYGVKMKH